MCDASHVFHMYLHIYQGNRFRAIWLGADSPYFRGFMYHWVAMILLRALSLAQATCTLWIAPP